MRHSMKYATVVLVLVALAASAGSAAAQAGAAPVRGLSIDEAVQLALEQNLGIAAERFNPQIQDTAIAQAQSYWLPTVTTSLQNVNQDNPATNALAGGQTITDHRFTTQLGYRRRR